MRRIINTNHIVDVHINEQSIAEDVVYREPRRNFLGSIVEDEGFYINVGSFNSRFIKLETIPPDILINGHDKFAFKKANIVIEFSNGKNMTLFFNTNEEMYLYAKREFQGREWKEFD